MSRLHLFPQEFSHGDAWLVGDRESLTAVRDTITRVLDSPDSSAKCTQAMGADGEGYALIVVLQQAAQHWERMLLPYAELEDKREDALHPFAQMNADLYRTLIRGLRKSDGA